MKTACPLTFLLSTILIGMLTACQPVLLPAPVVSTVGAISDPLAATAQATSVATTALAAEPTVTPLPLRLPTPTPAPAPTTGSAPQEPHLHWATN